MTLDRLFNGVAAEFKSNSRDKALEKPTNGHGFSPGPFFDCNDSEIFLSVAQVMKCVKHLYI